MGFNSQPVLSAFFSGKPGCSPWICTSGESGGRGDKSSWCEGWWKRALCKMTTDSYLIKALNLSLSRLLALHVGLHIFNELEEEGLMSMLLFCRGDKDYGTTPVIQECLRSWLCHQEGSLLIQSSSERSQILNWRCHVGFGPRCIWSKVCIFPLTLYIVTLQCWIQD